MTDVIQAVGPHKDKNGERCEVKHIDQGIAFGFDSDGDPSWWKCDTGNWQGAGDAYRLHIVGPWIEPPTVDVGEGWRLLEDGEVIEDGDEYLSVSTWRRREEHVGDKQRALMLPTRRRVPQPFRISDHGPGVYLTRDGREAHISDRRDKSGCEEWWGWAGEKHNTTTWADSGLWAATESVSDLVRYLRPLPKPEWTPTDNYQQTTIVDGCEWTTQWQGRPPMTRRIEQKWTNGTESEWRPVTTTTEGA
jgi:hypothetical protein